MKHECRAPALTHLCEPRARQVEVHIYVLADVLTEEQERACEGRMSEDQLYTLFGIHMVAAPDGEQCIGSWVSSRNLLSGSSHLADRGLAVNVCAGTWQYVLLLNCCTEAALVHIDGQAACVDGQAATFPSTQVCALASECC